MPLVAHNNLPTFGRLRDRGQSVLSLDRARKQDIRELHIGFLNMMPDAALTATEEQFIRLVGNCNQIAQFYVYPFSLPELNRSQQAVEHIKKYYFDFNDLRESGLDALIITGANVATPSLEQEPFWDPLIEVVKWAENNVASILCSCLATHALVRHLHGVGRHRLAGKKWGVFNHRVARSDHPLIRDVNTRFDAPHSRYNEVRRDELEATGIAVLADSPEAGVHLAVSPDLFRVVYFQGHPEYSANSLMKEYKREVHRYLNGDIDSAPPFPENYFSADAAQIALEYISRAEHAAAQGRGLPEFPDDALGELVDNTWGDTGKMIVNNWLGLVYQITNLDRRLQFMPDVDPADPLQLRVPGRFPVDAQRRY